MITTEIKKGKIGYSVVNKKELINYIKQHKVIVEGSGLIIVQMCIEPDMDSLKNEKQINFIAHGVKL